MRSFLALLRHELAILAPIWWIALAAVVLSWTAPWLLGTGNQPPSDVRAATSLFLAAVVAFLAALAVGAGLGSRELAEGRLGFRLGLPVSLSKIWLAQVGAGAVTVFGAALLTGIPALLEGTPTLVAREAGSGWGAGLTVWSLGLSPLLLALVVHVASVAFRDRGAWIALDLAGAAVVGWAVWWSVGHLRHHYAHGEISVVVLGLTIAAVLWLVVAGWRGLAEGRALLGPTHRRLALWSWAGLLGLAGLAAVAGGWVTATEPSDLANVRGAVASPAGPWAVVHGSYRWRPTYAPISFVNLETGSSISFPSWYGIQDRWLDVDDTGTFAVVAEPKPDGSSDLTLLRRGAEAQTVATLRDLDRFPDSVAVGPGGRIARAFDDRLEVWDLREERLLAATRLPGPSEGYFEGSQRFVGADRLRVVRTRSLVPEEVDRGGSLRIFDLRIPEGRLEIGPVIEVEGPSGMLLLSRDASRCLVLSFDGEARVAVVDLDRGEVLESAGEGEDRPRDFAFFGDTAAVLVERGGRLVLGVLDSGSGWREIDVGPGIDGGILGQWTRTEVAIAAVVGDDGDPRTQIRTASLETGERRLVSEAVGRLEPASRPRPLTPGTLGSRLLVDRGSGELVAVDPSTGHLEALLR